MLLCPTQYYTPMRIRSDAAAYLWTYVGARERPGALFVLGAVEGSVKAAHSPVHTHSRRA